MLRDVDLSEISDGKLYTANDMVKADCMDCIGCSECCRIMADTIILDPYDVFRLSLGIGSSFAELMAEKRVEIGLVDGILLPYLCMREDTGACSFLDEEGRCSVHSHRPGFCRLFPLGRVYDEEGDFKYFLQTHECVKTNRTKIKVSKWIDTPNLKKYEEYIKSWHKLTRALNIKCDESGQYEVRKELTMNLIKLFFLMPYEEGDFYPQFDARLESFYSIL